MKKAGKVIVCILVAAVIMSQMIGLANAADKEGWGPDVQPGLSRQAMYEWNMGKAVAVTELDDVSEGTCWIVTKEQDVTKAPDVDLACEMLSYYRVEAYFGEDVMRNRALEANSNALIMYNYLRTAQSCDALFKPESYTYAEFLRSFSSSVFSSISLFLPTASPA